MEVEKLKSVFGEHFKWLRNEDGKAYISDINRMRACADKLRKEMGV